MPVSLTLILEHHQPIRWPQASHMMLIWFKMPSVARSLAVGFILSWRLAVVALPVSLLFVLPMIINGKCLKEVEVEKGKACGIAGGIAEQAISYVRTLVSYVVEQRTLERFNQALEKSTALGIEQGFLKGVVFGTSGLVYAIWAFQAMNDVYQLF